MRLWLIDQLEPANPMYTISAAFDLAGTLRVDALEAALNEIVRRHEALRTVFLQEKGSPYQIVQPFHPVRLRMVDAETPPEPFDLAKGPLFRVELVRKGEREHLLALQIHHIVSDAWSFKLFTQELAALYADFVRGGPPSLPPLPLQFSDYAIWERQWLRPERLEPQLAYWKSHLAGPLPVIQLPSDHVRQPKQTHRGALHRFYLPKPLMDAVKAFSQAASVTPFMTLLAAFQTLIYRYTGQEDVLVGSAFAGRGKREVHGLIGFFVNTLPLRVHLGGEPSFAELLKRVREVALGAYANQDVPFIKLVQELQPDRDTSYAPLVQIMFVLRQKAPVPVYPLPELTMSRPKEVDSGVAKFELSWSMEEEEENFLALIEYNADLFDRARIERFAEHFVILLRAAIEQPDRSIATLPLLTERERRLLETAETPAAPQACFHRIFEARAAEDPDKTAVIFGDARLTYGELDARANRLARYLRQHGVSRDDRVGIRMDRSLDLVVAILGIFKAGGAYVPIDPTLPEERIAFLLEDARPRLVLAQVDVDEVGGTLDHDEDSHQLAYVIYTSGSTGKPKGVQVEHAGLLNLLQAQIETFGVTERSRVLQFASMSFDASIFEIVMALGTGATLVVAEHLTVGARLLELLERQAITHATLPPSVLVHLPEAELPALETIITAGEACPQGLVDRWAGAHRFFNAYGPTEATVWSTVARCHPGERVTIGRPIAHTRIHILDSRLQPAALGVPGEMYIGGVGLARGYLGRPELTKERFIDSPWGRLYRAGDLGRYLDDGNIDFLGRTDDQVKLRGFRIELEEVENALLQYPGVREAVVLVKDDALAAFYAGNASATEVRAFVKEKLPSYMVPAVCLAMEFLPLTTNNKIDKAALARLDVGQRGIDGYDAPTTVTEEVVAGIWADVLKVDRVGVREDFFGLGGHSLQAVQVVSRLGEAFGRSVPLSAIFERPTVAELAGWLEHAERPPSPAPALKVGRRERRTSGVRGREPLQLSFAQERLWFLYALNPGRADYNIPAVIELRGALDVERLRAALGGLVERHEALRTRVVDVEGVPQAVLGTGPLECAVLEDDVHAAALREAQRPFDLANELPIRATLLRCDEQHHVLLLTIHHIAADDRSLRILLEDLDALVAGRPLPDLPVQYKDFAAWQRQWLTGDVLTQQLAYWRKQLAHAPPPLNLPAVGPRSTKRTGAGDSASRSLPTALVEALQRVGRRENATLFMTLLAAFNALLHRYTGETELLVGSPVANRGPRDVENVVGYFGNTLVLRTDASGEPTFRALLTRVRSMALGAYEHADIPFENVVDELGLARDRGQAPLVQIMFALQDTAPMPSRIGNLEARISETDNKTAKFDLVLLLRLQEDGLSVRVQYSTDAFDAGTIERMLAHYHQLIAGIVQNPDQPIHALPLLTDEEQHQRRAWNATRTDYPQDACVHELFEAQVQRTPDAPAVVWREEHRTYRQLNEEANRLAHHLLRCGVGAETPVGLYMDRSLDMVVGLLAILKAGGVHVPLDPGYPQERIAFMLSDARVSVLLTHGRLASALPAHTATVVNVDTDRGALHAESAENPQHRGQVDDLAYAIYTSGSTGHPKGVAIPHRAINRLVFRTNYIDIRPEDRIAQASNASFDAAIFEIWGALLHGACLVGIDKEVAISPQDFTEHVRQHGITVLFLTTALFHLIAHTTPSGLRSVRDVLIGGDALDGGCVKAVLEHGPPGRVLNVYGPTESTTFATYYHVRQPPNEGTIVPIGVPLSNTEIHVLDAHLQPVPVGVPGEIYIGGAGLARGYLHRPDLTAGRFVTVGGIRLYKTGDRARYLPGGTLEFLERLDHQVKLRGYRIELGEIEATLRAHPSVSDAAVLVREDTPGEKLLVAYVGRAAHHETKAADLRRHVREQLPSFMVPAHFIVLDALPLSPNGKIDRKHLAQIGNLDSPISGRESDYVAPRSELERKISAVWEDVLHRKDVSIHDNFFDLGGSSLLVPRTLSKLNGVLDKKLALITLFQYPSISSLAKFLTRETSRQDTAPGPFIQTKETADTMRASRSRQAQRRRKTAP
ncbi:amino acid adenylation domain-containing protein [Pendulispora rubella]|uniref:Amino acid adenylation domain-containing protein n=2 Tax=Pendulispora rubella TaxID=2741070 RepID=A0ABZ2KSQ2_9BACT